MCTARLLTYLLPETLISSPVPFDRTPAAWKLALLNYLVGMKASGYNIAAVGEDDETGRGGGDPTEEELMQWVQVDGMVRKKVGFLHEIA